MLAELTWESVLTGYGPLGVFCLVALYAIRTVWKTYLPHIQAKLRAQTEKEEQQVRLFQALSESEPSKLEILRRQTALTETIAAHQIEHSHSCKSTHELVKEIHQRVLRMED